MKNPILTALGILAIAALGCDARPPATSTPSPGATEADFTYESLVELIGNPDDFAVARDLGERLPKMGPGSIPVIEEVLIDAATLELDPVEHQLLIRYWARHDPGAATWFALARTPRAYRVGAIHATVRTWAAQDPEKALVTVRPFMNEGGDSGAAAQVAFVRGWYESRKPGLEQYMLDLGLGFERQRALTAFSTAMIRDKGVDALLKWAEAVPTTNQQYKLEVFRAVGRALVPFDLMAAQRFCDAHCEGPFGSNLRDRIASRWADKDGPAAIEWVAKAPQSEERDVALRYTYAVWSRRVPNEALPWMKKKLEASPQDPWLEPILPIYARVLGKTVDLEQGLAVADKLAGPLERESIMVEILRYWRQKGPKEEAVAEAWLEKNKPSKEFLDRVRAPQTKIEALEQERDQRLASAPKP